MSAKPIVEFIKDKPKYLRLSDTNLPICKDQWGHQIQRARSLKEADLCITDVKAYNKDLVQVEYFDSEVNKTYFIVPNAFIASILPPDKLEEMEKKYSIERDRYELRSKLSFAGTCGSDPEIFVEDKDGQVIPAFNFLGPKTKPFIAKVVSSWTPNNCYWDGFQAEFDTMPNTCFSGQADSIHFGLQGVLTAARAYNKDAKLSFRPVMDIPPEMLAEGKPEHVQFGCMPSLNAYGMSGLQLPGHEVSFRPAGGHMHFGLYSFKKEKAVGIVKAIDAILGVACVSMFAKFDDPRRRQLYGLAGEYRLPAHGIEYRVLSNAWLIHPLLAHIVFDLGRTAAMVGMQGMLERWECPEAETVRIINEHDVDAARKVLSRNEQFLKRLIEVKYYSWWDVHNKPNVPLAAEYVYNVIMNGLESVVADPTNIEGNWNLNGAESAITTEDKTTRINAFKDGTWLMHSDGPGKNVMFVFKHNLQDKKV